MCRTARYFAIVDFLRLNLFLSIATLVAPVERKLLEKDCSHLLKSNKEKQKKITHQSLGNHRIPTST